MNQPQDAPTTNSRPKPVNGQYLMFDNHYRPVVVSQDAAIVREFMDFNPETNRWAAKDTLMNLLRCFFKRPVASAGVTLFFMFCFYFAMGMFRGAILGFAGAAQPVSFNQVDKASADEVGYWLVNNTLIHGATTTTKGMLVNWASNGQVPAATYVSTPQQQANPNMIGNTPLIQVSDQQR